MVFHLLLWRVVIMLVNFTFKNVRSFYGETMFSMEASKDSSFRDFNVFTPTDNRQTNNKCDLLKSALIFGPNASGKTNFMKALDFMRNVVLTSASKGRENPIGKNAPFAFFKDAESKGSLYEVEIIMNKKFYRYGFVLNSGIVTSEWLETVNGRTTSLFSRGDGIFKIRGFSSKQMKVINVSDNTLFLSIGSTFNTPIKEDIDNVIAWFRNLIIVFEQSQNCLDIYNTSDYYKNKALKILQEADIGISGLEIEKTKIGEVGSDHLTFSTNKSHWQLMGDGENMYDLDILTKYPLFDNETNLNQIGFKNIRLFGDYDFNSEGTTKLLMYLGYILKALDQGRVVVIDEIDSRLHFLVSDHLINMFNSIDQNPNNAQLIATAHDVMLMDGAIRRDQIYFTSKDRYGVSDMNSLADFKDVRKTDLFSKKYLAGFYTDLPDFNRGI